MPKEKATKGGKPGVPTPIEQSRDMYGFMVRPQHLERYREYCPIYKEEEEERSERWDQFLRTVNEISSSSACLNVRSCITSDEMDCINGHVGGQKMHDDQIPSSRRADRIMIKAETGSSKLWGQLRKSLWALERTGDIEHRDTSKLSSKEKVLFAKTDKSALATADERLQRNEGICTVTDMHANELSEEDALLPRISLRGNKERTGGIFGEGSGEDTEDEFLDAAESTDDAENMVRSSSSASISDAVPLEVNCSDGPWEEELRSLVRGGVPMALRGELWQVFVGTKRRRIYGHYSALLTLLADGKGGADSVGAWGKDTTTSNYVASKCGILEKWTSQIEKDLPRTFPGHPALDEDGRDALRRLLTAYARHNPSVGYCQAMNFLAALLLLLMPEENAFWTLTGILDDYFEGYYSEKMIEAQVDQLVFEDLVREYFPKLVNHLDLLGVRVAWVSGPWFLSIFVNVLPWESVLRVWDVLLFEGNRCMLFRTALALMEMNGHALSATRDAGDAVALLQSMAGATFDSSQLVMMACMGYQSVKESALQTLRSKHRPAVLAALEERTVELSLWRNSVSAITPKFIHKEGSGVSSVTEKPFLLPEGKLDDILQPLLTPAVIDAQRLGLTIKLPVSFQEMSVTDLSANDNGTGSEDDEQNTADLREQISVEQVKWLKNELSHALEERKAAITRAGELENALVELSVQDNRRLLAATVEKLEAEVAELRSILAQKEEHEASLVQVIVRMEQEQGIADDAKRFAEQEAAAKRQDVELLQANFEAATEALKDMEKRAVMAESMLEATLSYQQLGNNSPHGSFRRSSMDPLVRLSESVGSPLVKDVRISRSHSSEMSGSSNQENQGLFGRRFSLNWRDTSK